MSDSTFVPLSKRKFARIEDIENLLPDEEAHIPVYKERWIRRIVDAKFDAEAAKKAVASAYKAVGYAPPTWTFICHGPIEVALVQGLIRRCPETDPAKRTTEAWDLVRRIEKDGVSHVLRNRAPHGALIKQCINASWVYPHDGAGWSAWRAFFDFFYGVFGLAAEVQPHIELDKAGVFWWWCYENVAVLCAPPKMKFDRGNLQGTEDFRFHCEDGPAVEFADGFKLYFLQGVNVPPDLIEDTPNFEFKRVVTESNQEVKRVMCTFLGYEKILEGVGATIVHKDPELGKLWECQLNDDNGKAAKFVDVVCPSTGRRYVLRTHPDTTTVKGGLSRMVNKPEDMYSFDVEG